MKFELRQTVKLVASDEYGTIRSRMESTNGEPMYQVLYKSADRRQVQQWWSESDLVAAGSESDLMEMWH